MERNRSWNLSGSSLHILAMAAMLCDHLWATVVPGNDWLTGVGRLAFPIFAFLLVEGYCHTGSFRKYLKRMTIGAVISELPFNLLSTGLWIWPFQQNVLWTFCLGLLCLKSVDNLWNRERIWLFRPLAVLTALGFLLAGQLLMVDYMGYGIATILCFRVFRGRKLWQMLGQLGGLIFINGFWMGGVMVPVLGWGPEVPRQAAAVLALIPIWLYRGRQGNKSKAFRWFCYGFYPVHMLILGLLTGG